MSAIMNTPLITLQNVGCTYSIRKGFWKRKKHQALKDISMTIHRGETVGIIGRNGAGKSTLLKLIAGVILPNSGKIIRQKSISISLLTLQLGFSGELTGRDNAILSAMLLGHSKKEAIKNLEVINTFAELGKWFEEPLKSYSSGMKARLGFAVAMKMSPDVLLVDEVLGVGDVSFKSKSTQEMKKKMRSGQTVIFVSHDTASIRELCDTVIWIEEGKTLHSGPTKEILPLYLEQMKK